MTQGCLLYAFNNETIDYKAMAEWSAQRIKRYLGLPTTIISDLSLAQSGGQRILNPLVRKKSTWYNASRSNAWQDSPYDQTLILDVDYIVASDQLLTLFKSNQYFACHTSVTDATGQNNFASHEYFGQLQLPQAWATVCYFTRDDRANEIFDFVTMIKQNYAHYANLYKFAHKPFRNDYAFSLALTALNGHRLGQEFAIKWPLLTSSDNVVVDVIDDQITLYYNNNEKPMWNRLQRQDLHVMNKTSLGEVIARN